MSLAPLLDHWRERPQRTWSVVVTVLGDAVVPRGGAVWLATLIELFAAMGVDAGALRTAMSRLVADGWTERSRVGRNSSYSLTQHGLSVSVAAADRIYAAQPPAWDGTFQIVLYPKDRAALDRAAWGQAAPGVYVAPGPMAPGREAITLTAAADPGAGRLLAARAWPLDRLAASFDRFNTAFASLPAWRNASPLEAMVGRTLLIHEYRRIVLHAPALPAEILPLNWPGDTARRLCADAYRGLLPASEIWLSDKELPAPNGSLRRRFQL